MTEVSTILQQGNAWLFIPTAILLGALHGLEPGHSKTMMAAFILAVRGTVSQAVLLGLSATLSHTAVIWAVAIAGLFLGRSWSAGATEPYFQLASALLMIGAALWMLWRTWRNQQLAHRHHQLVKDDTGLDDQDTHSLAHIHAIRRRFSRQEITTGQIVLFGLTGGLIPCPASLTVLLLCLQLKKIALGATLVLCFSLGLAVTMAGFGVLAALSAQLASKQWQSARWGGLSAFANKAPYLSGVLIALIGLYVGFQGLRALS